MTLAELQRVLRAADPRAVLVPTRILERIITEAHDLRGPTLSVPHRKCLVIDRQTLFRHADQADLDLEPDQLLPDHVILLARPDADELSDLERSRVLLKFWRRLFHALVHIALEGEDRNVNPMPPERLRQRIAEIGQAEFEEVRTVLTQDHYLVPGASDRAVYAEFAAVYLEMRYFAIDLLPGLFPGLRDRGRIDRVLADDVDAGALFTSTRLEGAADPAAAGDSEAEETSSHERYWLLVRSAERAERTGNAVRAAILRTRAWRVAPAALSHGTRERSLADMRKLTVRLTAALSLSAAEAAEWDQVLPLLLDKADQRNRPAEARLLEDLQKVCLDHERDIYTLDAVEWAISGGKRPVKRPLPGLRLVRTTRHLRQAAGWLGAVRLADADRDQLNRLVRNALNNAEQAVKTRFGRVLTTALQDAGLRPGNVPERVAFAKMVEEWLDRIITNGFLTFGDLRDGISSNQLKMPDLKDPQDFVKGDPLLRLDRRLASLLDGVYRPSEIYLRWLERLTALNFGTRIGRAITLWVTAPIGGAFLLMQVLGVLLHLLFNVERNPAANATHEVLVGPVLAGAKEIGGRGATHFLLWAGLAGFILALVHVPAVRHACARVLSAINRALRVVLFDWPVAVLRYPPLRRALRGWPAQLVWWYLVKPLAVALVVWLLFPVTYQTREVAAIVFLAAALILNSRFGQAAADATVHGVVSFATLVRAGLLPGLYRLIVEVFRKIVDAVEWVFATVDDWLRFRSGETQLSMAARAVLGVLWFPIAYIARFYTVVLIEPGFNPIKAPVSYVAAKVMLPLIVTWTPALLLGLEPVLGRWLAYGLVLPTMWLLPDAAGFLFWETKENWSLYRANRRRIIRPVAVGAHGETIKALLIPGFHSGTVPRLYRRLRRAEHKAHQSRNWTAVRAIRLELEHVAGSVERFVARELVAVLAESASWRDQPLRVRRVMLAVNRICVEIEPATAAVRAAATSPGVPVTPPVVTPLSIEFELRAGWLIGCLADPGAWLDRLDASRLRAFTTALAGVYKLAGIDIVREQVELNLPGPEAEWDVLPSSLIVRPNPSDPESAIVHDLRGPHSSSGDGEEELRRLVFGRTPLYWDEYRATWERENEGQGHPGLDGWEQALVRRDARPIAAVTATSDEKVALPAAG